MMSCLHKVDRIYARRIIAFEKELCPLPRRSHLLSMWKLHIDQF